MDTVYYTLRSRKIKVSGGADLVTFVPAVQPMAKPGEKAAGEVLDFEACKRRLETKAAWKQLAQAAEEAAPADETWEEEPLPAPRPQRERVPLWLELGASAAVIVAALAAAAAFLSVL